MNKEKTQPSYEARLNHIRVTVWENSNNSDGKRWFNTTMTRRYLDDAKEWKDATTFNGLADLALLAEALRMAQDFIRRAESERPERGDGRYDD